MADDPTSSSSSSEEGSADQSTEVDAAVVTDGGYALIVADFTDPDAAMQAYEDLKAIEKDSDLSIDGVLVVKKDASSNELEVQKATDYSTRRGLKWGVVGGVVLGVLFPPSIIGSAVVVGAAGAGVGRLRHDHNKNEVADELADSIDPGHSGLIALVSDPAAVKLQKALDKADHIVQKAVDKAAAEEIKAEAKEVDSGKSDS